MLAVQIAAPSCSKSPRPGRRPCRPRAPDRNCTFSSSSFVPITSRLCTREPISDRAKLTRLMSTSKRSIVRPISSVLFSCERLLQANERVENAVRFDRVAVGALQDVVAAAIRCIRAGLGLARSNEAQIFGRLTSFNGSHDQISSRHRALVDQLEYRCRCGQLSDHPGSARVIRRIVVNQINHILNGLRRGQIERELRPVAGGDQHVVVRRFFLQLARRNRD